MVKGGRGGRKGKKSGLVEVKRNKRQKRVFILKLKLKKISIKIVKGVLIRDVN